MAKRIKVELRSLRKAVGERIKVAEEGIRLGEAAVKASKGGGRQAKANRASLAQARKMLRTLKRVQLAIEGECCNLQSQNCDFIFQ